MKYAFLLARQRSGTGALGSVLGKHPQLRYVGEVFHPSNVGQEQNFWTFLQQHVAGHPDEILPDQRYEHFLAFLEELSAGASDQTLVVDVKYRSVHHLDGGWRGLVARPTMFVRMIEGKVPMLHLTRRNALHSYVSGRLAEENQVWHTRDADRMKVASLIINPRQLSNYIANATREIALVEEWTKAYARKELFDYDEMFDSDGLIEAALAQRIAKRLGVTDFEDRSPSFIKQAPTRIANAIENYPLVRKALAGSEFAWMLD